ncbi:glycosyltransferase involved in cell wall biosynthesis [Azospirillum agricola]|uniref:glycosyltransferase n=1 Tax=Azospirillum agricola TaxID=1720247 RepID=UPI001AE533D3|nr:glycosyltransferase [Azospirillum agricola]MBP2227753.1 glycosyltransferase involved in cell wall biosynthesis [Azospirillum agricola]
MTYGVLRSDCPLREGGAQTHQRTDPQGRPRILHVTECFSTGVLTALAMICKELQGDFSFSILYGRRWETPADFEAMFPPETVFQPWDVSRSLNPLKDVAAVRQLRRTVQALEPDLIHAHSSKAGALVRLAFPRGRPSVIYTPHCYAFLRGGRARPSNRLFWAVEWLLGRTAHTTVAVGRTEYAYARQVARRAAMIPNMIELAQFGDGAGRTASAPDAAPLPGRRRTVVSVGSIRPQKNFPLFCEVAARLAGEAVDFLWVGAGEVPAGCAVPDNVAITGWLPHDRVAGILRDADIYIQTSVWEGLPISVLEAMSCGLPLVVTPADGNRELLTSFVNGFVCDTAAEFTEAIRLLCCHAPMMERMGLASRRLAEEYGAARVAMRWVDFYTHEIAERAGLPQAALQARLQ